MSNVYERHMLQLDDDEDDDFDEDGSEETLVRVLQGAGALGVEGLGGRYLYNETSSESGNSDDDDEEEYYKEYVGAPRGPVTRRWMGAGEESERAAPRKRGISDEQPEWFNEQPFQHSRKQLAHCLPGILLVLLLGGDLLVAVIAFGGLIAYLVYQAGLRQSAQSVVICTTVCAVIVIIYSTTPLLWKSLLNIVPLSMASVFTVLTGSWILLLMEDFCQQDPDQAKWLETMLFTLYPTSSLMLIVWFISFSQGGAATPYLLLTLGFLLLWLFQAPTQSSFVKPGTIEDRDIHPLVLDQQSSLVILALYMVTPVLHCFVYSLVNRRRFLAALIEICLILSASTFLASFLHLRQILDTFDVSLKRLHLVRWTSAIVAIVAVNFLLYVLDYKSQWLPWFLLIFIFEWAAFALLLGRNNKPRSNIFAMGLLLHTVVMAAVLPWRLEYHLDGSGWPVQTAFVLVAVNAVLSVITVLASRFAAPDTFGLLIIAESIVFVPTEAIFSESRLLSSGTAVTMSTGIVAVFLRLYYVKKLPKSHCHLAVSVHLAGLLQIGIDHDILKTSGSVLRMTGAVGHGLQFSAVLVLVALMLQVAVFEKGEELTLKQIFMYITSVALSATLSSFVFFAHLYLSMVRQLPSSVQHLGFLIAAVSLTVLKLSLHHKSLRISSGRASSLISLSAGLMLIFFKPEISLSWQSLPALSCVVSGVCFLVLVTQINRLRSQYVLYFLSLMAGLPVTTVGITMIFKDGGWPLAELYGLQCSVCLAMTFTALQQTSFMETRLIRLCWCGATLSVAMVLLDLGAPYSETRLSPGLLGAALGTLWTAAVVKFTAMSSLPRLGVERTPVLPTYGNVAALCGVFLAAIGWPHTGIPLELWLVCCSLGFFLLRKDKYIVTGCVARGNHYAPTVTATSVIVVAFALAESPLWTLPSVWNIMGGLVEMLFIASTTPVLATLTIYMWNLEKTEPVQRRLPATSRLSVVVLLTPVYLFLFVCGMSYAVWVLAAFGFSAGMWIWRSHFNQVTVF